MSERHQQKWPSLEEHVTMHHPLSLKHCNPYNYFEDQKLKIMLGDAVLRLMHKCVALLSMPVDKNIALM